MSINSKRMYRLSIHIITIILTICTLSSCSVNARIKKADKKYAIGEYYEAGEIYRQTYRRISTKDKALRARVAFMQGESHRILNNNKAVSAYKNAIRNNYPDSLVYLHYAQVLQYQGKYKEAIKQYDIYLLTHPNDYVAQAGKYACMQVETWKKETSRYKVTLAKEFNEKRTSSFAPAFTTEDGDALVFTSNRQEKSTDKKKKVRTSPVTGVAIIYIRLAKTPQVCGKRLNYVRVCMKNLKAKEEKMVALKRKKVHPNWEYVASHQMVKRCTIHSLALSMDKIWAPRYTFLPVQVVNGAKDVSCNFSRIAVSQ